MFELELSKSESVTMPEVPVFEESFVSVHQPGEYVVVVSCPAEDAAGMPAYRRLAELAGFDLSDDAGVAALSFTFACEDDARRSASRLPAGMVRLYAHGKLVA